MFYKRANNYLIQTMLMQSFISFSLSRKRFAGFFTSFVFFITTTLLLFNEIYAADTTHVTLAFNQVVTDPSKGVNSYAQWASFPAAAIPVRKIMLSVRFACPDSMRCADWDYSDRIYLKRKGGKNAKEINYTIAHMLTPYGGAFDKNWNFTWQVEVTDFSLWLRDSIEIVYEHTGYEENRDRGWKINLDFSFIKGKPAAVPLAIHPVYNGNYQFGNAEKSIDELLQPYSFFPNAQATTARLYVLQTGHGMDDAGCGEFCSKYREIWWNNTMISKKDLWKKCGDNPLYPQAGTWVTDRANWCPGYLNQPEISDQKTIAGKQNVFGIKMQPYTTTDKNVNENIYAYIIEYKSPELKNDVAIETIAVPSNVQVYGRKNPASFNPVITIKNNGATPLKSSVIRFGTIGYKTSDFSWKGDLAFNKTAEMILPGAIAFGEGLNKFQVEILKPNGKTDEYKNDNILVSEFQGVAMHGNQMIIEVKTNNNPGDNQYDIVNSAGKKIFERPAGSLLKNTLYHDTIQLENGAYSFMLADTSGDGLEFWYAVKAGRGSCRLLNAKGEMIKNFDSDFGSFLKYDFVVTGDSLQWSNLVDVPAVGAFPTMTTGKVVVDYFSNTLQNPVIQFIADTPGKELVEEHQYFNVNKAVFNYDFSYRPPQRYYLKVFVEGKLVFTKRVRVVAARND